MFQDRQDWPWYMGPPPKGLNCDDPPCEMNTNWFRRRKRQAPLPPVGSAPTDLVHHQIISFCLNLILNQD